MFVDQHEHQPPFPIFNKDAKYKLKTLLTIFRIKGSWWLFLQGSNTVRTDHWSRSVFNIINLFTLLERCKTCRALKVLVIFIMVYGLVCPRGKTVGVI